MKELIRVTTETIGNRQIKTCSARELHEFLQVGKDFSTWVNARIDKYGYKNHRDFEAFEVFPNSGENPNGESGGRPRKEYTITLNMAKELAMVENSPMGVLVRNYFIKCEEAVTTILPLMAQELLRANPMWRDIYRYKKLGLTHKEIGLLCKRDKSTIRDHVRRMEKCGLLKAPANLAKLQSGAKHLVQLSLFGDGVDPLIPTHPKYDAEVQ